MFKELLKKTRQGKNLSQTDMVDLLSTHPSFERLDKGTYSRWENGRTVPSTQRQIQIMLINSSLKDALSIAREAAGLTLIKSKADIEQRLFDKRFPNVSHSDLTEEISEFHYELNYSTNCNAITTPQYADPKISKILMREWGEQRYNDFQKLINPDNSNYLLLEYHNCEGELRAHHVIYLTTLRELIKVNKNRPRIMQNNLVHDNVLSTPSTYSSSTTIFCSSILESISFCLERNFTAEYIYIQTSRTAFKEYLESLEGTVTNFGDESKSGLKHFNKTYKWVGILIPFNKMVQQIPIFEAIYSSLDNKIEIKYLK
ncbi:helix-turn-helix domain-containing protein [Vibrio sp. L5-1]|uniref:helix-turn-helix domain-containing protein n=1 Tax=Vibrio sp. L5-1 TaxID=2912254 RepID=UPI001F300424|nr:helix-turn-helix transcriptional regulator [Vibrio sp. L5-1]MCF7497066.1 helix-turn-helix domain-containing protein [Vibrio sp. L5-1]